MRRNQRNDSLLDRHVYYSQCFTSHRRFQNPVYDILNMWFPLYSHVSGGVGACIRASAVSVQGRPCDETTERTQMWASLIPFQPEWT